MSDPIHVSETFGKIPNTSESFRTIPQAAEDFRTLPKFTERKESHTLTVREVARMFESDGVARTERSIINWCQPNKLGIPRLDAYFDPNERRYFISRQSVDLAIKEEQAKAAKSGSGSESVGTIPQPAEARSMASRAHSDSDVGETKTLRQEIVDLKFANRGKDYVIERLHMECEDFALERKEYIEKLMNSSHQIGELETKLLQLRGPSEHGGGQ